MSHTWEWVGVDAQLSCFIQPDFHLCGSSGNLMDPFEVFAGQQSVNSRETSRPRRDHGSKIAVTYEWPTRVPLGQEERIRETPPQHNAPHCLLVPWESTPRIRVALFPVLSWTFGGQCSRSVSLLTYSFSRHLATQQQDWGCRWLW